MFTYEFSYRFSISWSRIFPDGIVKDSDGNIRYNKAGLDFYDKIVNLCLENNIKPFIHKCNILAIAVIVVTCFIAILIMCNITRFIRECVPNYKERNYYV